MAVIYGVSEFTDEKGTDWKVKIVDGSISTSDLNYAFNLGPDGFRLSYDYDNFDRCKPILGSKVELTLLHNDTLDAEWNAFYTALDTAVEGTYRIEIYRDPDGTNEAWWIGEILPEQTIIPDSMPNAAVSITAADGLGNLKGIDYNNAGSAYTGTDLITAHLSKALGKVHSSNFWGSSDTFIKFYEDFIGAEYKASIGVAQNQQLNNAKVEHTAFHNINSNGLKEYYSAYTVLESIAKSFNSCIFMARGNFWFVPMGCVQSHLSSDSLKTWNKITGNGTVTYNTSENLGSNYVSEFGNNNSKYEKLTGWERTSTPAFKEVLRVRNYQGDLPLLLVSGYSFNTTTGIGLTKSDEDAEQPSGRIYTIDGVFRFSDVGGASAGTFTGDNRCVRPRIRFTVRVGDAGGTEVYADRDDSYSTDNISGVALDFDDYNNNIQMQLPILADVTWTNNSANRVTWVGTPFDASTGKNTFPINTVDEYYKGEPFNITLPPLAADAEGLELTATLDFIYPDGSAVSTGTYNFILVSEICKLAPIRMSSTTDGEIEAFGQVNIKSINDDDARYYFNQNETLIGDAITENSLGVVKIFNGSSYVDSTSWGNLSESGTGFSINGLGVRERLAANRKAQRVERGTLYRTGSDFIHPYTVLKNVYDGNRYYQLTGLKFIAARCEYDIECIYLNRDPADITSIISGKHPTKGPGETGAPIGPVVVPKGMKDTTIQQANLTKTQHININNAGITGLVAADNSTGTNTLILPQSLPNTSHRNLLTLGSDGLFRSIGNGTAGEILQIASSGLSAEWAAAAGGESGWFNSTHLMKVMPTEFVLNDATDDKWCIEDGTTDKIWGRIYDSRADGVAYATKAIPTGYKATHVKVWGENESGTSNPITVRNFDHTDGDLTNSTSGNFNASIDITDITSSATQNILIKVTLSHDRFRGPDIIYGADITIVAV